MATLLSRLRTFIAHRRTRNALPIDQGSRTADGSSADTNAYDDASRASGPLQTIERVSDATVGETSLNSEVVEHSDASFYRQEVAPAPEPLAAAAKQPSHSETESTNDRDEGAMGADADDHPGATQTTDLAAAMSAVRTFVEAEDWDEKRRFLEANQHLLLTQLADSILQMNMTRAVQRGDIAIVNALESHRVLLRQCAEIGIAQGWAEAEVQHEVAYHAFQHAPATRAHSEGFDLLALVLQHFVNAHDWDEKRQILETSESILTSDDVLDLLGSFIESAEKRDPGAHQYFLLNYALLYRARQIGAGDAWEEFNRFRLASERVSDEKSEAESPITTIAAWLNRSTDRSRRRFLEEHQEIVGLPTDVWLQALHFRYAGELEADERIRDAELVLRDVRARGGGSGAISTAYVDIFGAYNALDICDWLYQGLIRLHALTTAEQIQTLRQLIARVEAESPVTSLVLVDLELKLAEVLTSSANTPDEVEDGTRLFEQALRSYLPAQYPIQNARVLTLLGYAYTQRQRGDHGENIEEAIRCYREALRVRTLRDLPIPYARTTALLGAAYMERQRGDHGENIEEAIRCYREALRVRTLRDLPEPHARTMCYLGNAYRAREEGSRSENLEEAIRCYRRALRVYTLDTYPEDYAAVSKGMGQAYFSRVSGAHRDNLEEAIRCYQEALRVYTLDAYPEQYAETQRAMGYAYGHWIVGNPHDYAGEAIRCYQEALRVYTLDAYPEQYAETYNRMGLAYRQQMQWLPWQAPGVNVEEAFRCFKEALRVFTVIDFPDYYADTQVNLGATFVQNDQVEQAIKCFEEALRVSTLEHDAAEYARAHSGLAVAHMHQHDFDAALHSSREALRVYTIENYPVDFRKVQLNLATASLDWAHKLQERQETGGVQLAYQIADKAFTEARRAQAVLGWRESDERRRALLQGEVEVLRHLYANHAWCLVQLGRPRDALLALEAGRAQALIESLTMERVSLDAVCDRHTRQYLNAVERLQAAKSLDERQELVTARAEFLEVRQAIRAHCYQDFLPSEPSYSEVLGAPSGEQTLIYVAASDFGGLIIIVPPATNTLRRTEAEPIVVGLPGLTIEAVDRLLSRESTQRWGLGGWRVALMHAAVPLLVAGLQAWELDHGEGEVKRISGTPMRDAHLALPPNIALLGVALGRLVKMWEAEIEASTRLKGFPSDVAKDLRHRLAQPLGEALGSGTLEGVLDWFYMEIELEELLSQLGQVIMQPLRNALDEVGLIGRSHKVALVACGKLGAFPLHAAPVKEIATGKYVPFQETCEFAYQASARTLAAARAELANLPTSAPVFAVGNPLPLHNGLQPLEWAEAEAEQIVAIALEQSRITPVLQESVALLTVEATKQKVSEVLGQLRAEHPGLWVEMATHGYADPSNLGNCYMVLANNELLTLADMQRKRLLEGVRCFSASGCVTAVGDLETAPDEISSFAAGVLQAGAAAAVATQWPVDDLATFLLMVRFAELVLGGEAVTPAHAMREAAKWLRTATRADLEQFTPHGTNIRLRPASVFRDRGSGIAFQSSLRGVIAKEAGAYAVPENRADVGLGSARSERFSTGLAYQTLTRMLSLGATANTAPFASPMYWAATVVFGA